MLLLLARPKITAVFFVSVIAAPLLCEGRLYVVGAKSKKQREENLGDADCVRASWGAAVLRPYMTVPKF
jgi:hypothetical protein